MNPQVSLRVMEATASHLEKMGKEYIDLKEGGGFENATKGWWQRAKACVSSFFGFGSGANKRAVAHLLDTIRRRDHFGERYANLAATRLNRYLSGKFTLSGATAGRVLRELIAQRTRELEIVTTDLGNQFVLVSEGASARGRRHPEQPAAHGAQPQAQEAAAPQRNVHANPASGQSAPSAPYTEEEQQIVNALYAHLDQTAEKLGAPKASYATLKAEMGKMGLAEYKTAIKNWGHSNVANTEVWMQSQAKKLIVQLLSQFGENALVTYFPAVLDETARRLNAPTSAYRELKGKMLQAGRTAHELATSHDKLTPMNEAELKSWIQTTADNLVKELLAGTGQSLLNQHFPSILEETAQKLNVPSAEFLKQKDAMLNACNRDYKHIAYTEIAPMDEATLNSWMQTKAEDMVKKLLVQQ